MAGGTYKKLWRCNQWWNKRCRARVFTIGDTITPLNKFHTHEDIIRRKKRVSRKLKMGGVGDGDEGTKEFIVVLADAEKTERFTVDDLP